MKNILILTILIYTSSSAAESLELSDLTGKWKFHAPEHSIRYKIASWITGASPRKMHLTFTTNKEIHFTREFKNGETESIKASRFETNEDLLIIWLPRDHGAMYKLTLSGWNFGHSKRLFGYFYLYDNHGLFNGWPVSFEPEK